MMLHVTHAASEQSCPGCPLLHVPFLGVMPHEVYVAHPVWPQAALSIPVRLVSRIMTTSSAVATHDDISRLLSCLICLTGLATILPI